MNWETKLPCINYIIYYENRSPNVISFYLVLLNLEKPCIVKISNYVQ